MSSYLREAEIAANWWVDKVTNPTFDNGDKSLPSVIAMLTLSDMVEEVNHNQKLTFRKALYEKVIHGLDKGHRVRLAVEYDPCEILSDCANIAGIKLTNFPIKTSMNIVRGHVRVSIGHIATHETIYQEEAVS